MDNFFIHMEPLARRYPLEIPISSIGYIPRKRDWIHKAFSSFNFSFILRGRGEFRIWDTTWSVEAPCVITQWPGVFVEYGAEQEWEELYLIYHPSLQPLLEARHFSERDRPVWYVREAASLRRRFAELAELLKDPGAFGRADEIDRLCERMVLESLISEHRPSLTPLDKTILSIRTYVEEHYTEWIDFDFLASEFGLSPATFRRHWARHVSRTPSSYVTHLRMQQACRLLAETHNSVGQIARDVGYEDVLYFSRVFRKTFGQTATEYRKQNLVGVVPAREQE